LILDVMNLGPEAWRWLFVVGVLPAFFALWVRAKVPEPKVWQARKAAGGTGGNPFAVLFGRELWLRTTLAIILTASVQFAYWGLFFWLPSFLATPIERGGAGMTLVRSMSWIIPMQIGAYFGYLSFGFLADRFGKEKLMEFFAAANGMNSYDAVATAANKVYGIPLSELETAWRNRQTLRASKG